MKTYACSHCKRVSVSLNMSKREQYEQLKLEPEMVQKHFFLRCRNSVSTQFWQHKMTIPSAGKFLTGLRKKYKKS